MKLAAIVSGLFLSISMVGNAYAQSSGKTVSPAVTRESGSTVSGAASDAAKDAMKQMDKKPADMKEAEDMKKKAKDAEGMMKKKMK